VSLDLVALAGTGDQDDAGVGDDDMADWPPAATTAGSTIPPAPTTAGSTIPPAPTVGVPTGPAIGSPPAPGGAGRPPAAGKQPSPSARAAAGRQPVAAPPAGGPPSPAVTQPGEPPPPGPQAIQPAMAKERRQPVRPAPVEQAVAPGGPTCSACGAANEPGRRFCRRCGAPVAGSAPTTAPTRAAPARLSWWRRLLARLRGGGGDHGEGGGDRTARAAYRRSLDVRFRVLRWVAVLATLGLGAGAAGLAGINPVSGARSLWERFFPRDERVTEVTAATSPEETERPDFAAGAAVDGAPDTAWAAGWTLAADDPAADACGDLPTGGGGDAALVLNLPAATELSRLEVQPGLPAGDPDRPNQWRPTRLELRYEDGSCEEIELRDEPGSQEHDIEAEETTSVRVVVLDAAPPTSGDGDLVSIGELRLYRPA
jgi:hypothetical protein